MSSDSTWSPKEASFEDGSSLAIETYGLEKTAFLGALKGLGTAAKGLFSGSKAVAAAPGVASRGLKATGEALGGAKGTLGKGFGAVKDQVSKVTKPLGNLTTSLDKSFNRGATRFAGNLGERMGLSKGAVKNMQKYTAIGTRGALKSGVGQGLVGGTLLGGIGAATAEDGQGWDAFKKGFGTGAILGGVGGALGKSVGNLGTYGVGRLNKLQGISQGQRAAHGLQRSNVFRGPNSRMRQLFTGEGTGGRLAAGASLTAGAGALTADILGSEAMLPKTAAEQSKDPLVTGRQLGGALGSTTGFLSTGIPLNILADDPGHLAGVPLKGPRGVIYRSVIPAAAALAGGIGGGAIGAQFDPPPTKLPEQEKLEQIDFDKLFRYYKKQEPSKQGG